ncbi:MAG: hypothetical protein IJU40_07215 [Desulfovibrionaceae bacterium]|nr:hypothetical protein [Desulfovibrionaceae bacterium]
MQQFLSPNAKELKKSFRELCLHAQDPLKSKQNCLDIFYAVECGLKAIIIENEFKYLSEKYKTHDLDILIDKVPLHWKKNTIQT